MKRLSKIIASSLLLLGVASAPAMAGDHGRDRGYRDHDRGQHHGRHDRGEHRGWDNRRYDRHDYRPGPRVVYVQPRYRHVPPRVVYRPAPHAYWVRGGRYYGSGYAPTYVVDDWGRYGLRSPPRGYYWRRSDAGDFLLVAAATGIIADLLLGH